MSKKRKTPQKGEEWKFPERVLVADIAHPECDEYELELVPDDVEWGDLPVMPYVRADESEAGEAE